MALIYNATFDKTTRKLSFEDKAGNEIYSFTVPERGPGSVDDITKPLTFKATQDGSTVTLSKAGSLYDTFQTSRDGGNTWVDYTINTAIALNTGDEVSFRAKNDRTSGQLGRYDYYYFQMTGKIEAWHNVMSLYRTNDFSTYESVVKYAFNRLFFNCTSLTKAPALPATTLALGCHLNMFQACQSLTKAPALPATTLANSCYSYMFQACQSLTKAPELPATTLASYCYEGMFSGCQSLNEVRISATTTATDALKGWLSNVSATGDFYCDPNATIFPTGTSGIPANWRRLNINEEAPAVDDITKPLTFKATQDGSTVGLIRRGRPSGDFQTSRDGGNTWTDYTLNTAITLNAGEEVSFRAKADRTSDQNYDKYFYFVMTGKIEAWHNVMSLYRTNDFATYNTVVSCAFNKLFYYCKSLTKAPVLPATTLEYRCYSSMFFGCQSLTKALALPATTLATECYSYMFSGCQSLTKAPELPATTLAKRCYECMFQDCRSLTKAPELPATTLAEICYSSMFRGCQSLTKAPELPATTLIRDCYKYMFQGCQSLTKAPELPATTLTINCYESMFQNCRSLTKAPVLPATTLTKNCYYCMFQNCRSLKEVRISATTTAQNALIDWLSGVSATGDFYCDPNSTIFQAGSSWIPSGWRKLNINDYPT